MCPIWKCVTECVLYTSLLGILQLLMDENMSHRQLFLSLEPLYLWTSYFSLWWFSRDIYEKQWKFIWNALPVFQANQITIFPVSFNFSVEQIAEIFTACLSSQSNNDFHSVLQFFCRVDCWVWPKVDLHVVLQFNTQRKWIESLLPTSEFNLKDW